MQQSHSIYGFFYNLFFSQYHEDKIVCYFKNVYKELCDMPKITVRHDNGDVYEGECKENNIRQGKGEYKWSDGSVYEGEWQNNIRHGEGEYKWFNGKVYEGGWKDDKMHGKGKYTYVNGNITVEGVYENGMCIDFTKVIIKDTNGKEHSFFKQRDVLHYQAGQEQPKPVSDKNKRLELILKQLGNYRTNIKKPDDFIYCKDKTEFQQQIRKLKESSKTKGTTITKIFEIPGHGFAMVFKEGKAYCYDNGTIENNLSYPEYREVLTSEQAEYKKPPPISSYLNFLLANDNGIEIEMPKDSFVCRHLAFTIFEKMQELISKKIDPIDGLEKYCKKLTEGECMPSPSPLLRCNSWEKDSWYTALISYSSCYTIST